MAWLRLAFFPAEELVRAKIDLKRDDGSVAIPIGTSGIVRGRDDAGGFYWVLFQGTDEPIPAREGEIERICTAAKAVDWDLVQSIAEQVRGGAMSGHYDVNPEDAPSPHSYSGSNRYPEQPSDKSGGCDEMSERLRDRLADLGYPEARTVDGNFFLSDGTLWSNHTWVELGGRIIDLTADQFNAQLEEPMPKVNIVAVGDPHYLED